MLDMFRGWWNRGRNYPSEGWVVSANEEARHTPDLCELESSPMQLLFLPCELQERHLHGELASKGGTPLFKAFTKHSFGLYRNRENNRAILLEEPKHTVKGELWAISSDHYSSLDNYKENGYTCQRRRVEIVVPYTRHLRMERATKVQSELCNLISWVYVGIPKYWTDRIDDGFQYPSVRLYRPKNPRLSPFYFYHPNECKE